MNATATSSIDTDDPDYGNKNRRGNGRNCQSHLNASRHVRLAHALQDALRIIAEEKGPHGHGCDCWTCENIQHSAWAIQYIFDTVQNELYPHDTRVQRLRSRE